MQLNSILLLDNYCKYQRFILFTLVMKAYNKQAV